ncbi:10369_t:CDS:2 [Cetraspora pellucida]|uniref:10369_t:CDS:1 n=1 Tax=Cetraspora pellucida TaxID=1433469 RepID=A0ACA9LL34_9GLOM|nr:10369_t:CDS:2 [Cetraspora pellucida]
MAIGLSQISEYVFILSSRAKSLEIISREDIPIGGYRLLTNDSDLTISLPTNNIGKAE